MEIVKDKLFDVLVIAGLITIILIIVWCIIELLNTLFKFTKYIIMYYEYKRNEDLYDLKNKLVISKDGSIPYSCIGDLKEQEEILHKAIKYIENTKTLREKYSK